MCLSWKGNWSRLLPCNSVSSSAPEKVTDFSASHQWDTKELLLVKLIYSMWNYVNDSFVVIPKVLKYYIKLCKSYSTLTRKKKKILRTGKVTQASKGVCCQAWLPEFSPRTHISGENKLPQVVFWPLLHANNNKCNYFNFKNYFELDKRSEKVKGFSAKPDSWI